MTDLRSVCIEAMADAMYGDLRVGHNPGTIYQLGARHALDALLGVLEEHADDWAEATKTHPWYATAGEAESLLAVLREDNEVAAVRRLGKE